MQFASIIALFVATAAALPASSPALEARACSIFKCAAALGPVGIACVASALQEGLDPLTDLPCIVGAINDVANTPAACQGCLSELK